MIMAGYNTLNARFLGSNFNSSHISSAHVSKWSTFCYNVWKVCEIVFESKRKQIIQEMSNYKTSICLKYK